MTPTQFAQCPHLCQRPALFARLGSPCPASAGPRRHILYTPVCGQPGSKPGKLGWEPVAVSLPASAEAPHLGRLKDQLLLGLLTAPGWGRASRAWLEGHPLSPASVFSGCSLLSPRMSGDVSPQVLHVLASHLRPARRIRHTLH